MDKRSLIAIALSAFVIFSYPYVMKHYFPKKAEVTDTETATKAQGGIESDTVSNTETSLFGGTAPSSGTGINSVPDEAQARAKARPVLNEQLVRVETPLYRAELTSLGGGVKSWELKKYKETSHLDSKLKNIVASRHGGSSLRTRLVYNNTIETATLTPSASSVLLSKDESKELVLRGKSPQGLDIEKKYRFNGSDYLINTELRLTNSGDKPFNGFVDTILLMGHASGKKKKKSRATYHSGGLVSIGDNIIRHKDKNPAETRNAKINWLGVETKYFLSAIIPVTDIPVSWTLQPSTKDQVEAGSRFALKLMPGETAVYSYKTFMGPKKYDLLKREKSGLEGSVEFGYVAFMARPLLSVLNFLQSYVVNYGIAIIILTIVIKVIFYPLTHHGLKSMHGMKKVQPQIAAIKERYKDDKARLNKEIMGLYKKYKINPVGGCLPMILQIPVFIALYEVLYVCIELRHAPFILWIHDLSAMDPYYITPLIMGGSMFLQQKMTPVSADPMQAKMMLFMPVIFTVMFLKFPAGLVIYWLVNNILSIAQQYYINRTDTAPI